MRATRYFRYRALAMKLSAEQFSDLLSTFYAADQSHRNQRRASRVALQARIQVIPIVEGLRLPSLSVSTCDFSARGLSFMHEKPFTPGDQIVVVLPRKSGGSVELLSEVVRSARTRSELCRVGVEFTCAINGTSHVQTESPDEVARIRASMLG